MLHHLRQQGSGGSWKGFNRCVSRLSVLTPGFSLLHHPRCICSISCLYVLSGLCRGWMSMAQEVAASPATHRTPGCSSYSIYISSILQGSQMSPDCCSDMQACASGNERLRRYDTARLQGNDQTRTAGGRTCRCARESPPQWRTSPGARAAQSTASAARPPPAPRRPSWTRRHTPTTCCRRPAGSNKFRGSVDGKLWVCIVSRSCGGLSKLS